MAVVPRPPRSAGTAHTANTRAPSTCKPGATQREEPAALPGRGSPAATSLPLVRLPHHSLSSLPGHPSPLPAVSPAPPTPATKCPALQTVLTIPGGTGPRDPPSPRTLSYGFPRTPADPPQILRHPHKESSSAPHKPLTSPHDSPVPHSRKTDPRTPSSRGDSRTPPSLASPAKLGRPHALRGRVT